MAWDNIISRGIWLLIQPSNFLFLLLLLAALLIWKGHKKSGLSIIGVCLTLYLLVMTSFLTNLFMVPLEKRFSSYTNSVDHAPYSGIIVLGGAERINYSTYHDQVVLDDAAERLIEAAKLARQFPTLPIIYCGGGRRDGMMTESVIAEKFFTEAGIDLNRIRFDDKSYNTYTNALEAKKLIKPDEVGQWLLVTSAFHMPRAVGVYRKALISIQPYPVDYRTELNAFKINPPDAGQTFQKLDYAIHEWVGLMIYYLTGHSDDLYPAP
ncbi:MAG: YdcF family protein [Emcibacter sp.]|nr:YdcF family protein [Emcibacter sp.]